jgi:hypothetical protein
MRLLNIICILSCLLLLQSCKTDEQLKQEANVLAQERLEAMDYSTVDHYPLFTACDEIENTAQCFYEQLHELVAARLAPVAANITMSENDTMMVSMVVEATGHLKYERLLQCPKHLDTLKVDSLLQSRLQYLPRLSSAIKQDVPVKTSYKLPIILVPTDSLNVEPSGPSSVPQ